MYIHFPLWDKVIFSFFSIHLFFSPCQGYFEEEIAEYESLSNMHGDDILDYLSYHIDPAIFGHKGMYY